MHLHDKYTFWMTSSKDFMLKGHINIYTPNFVWMSICLTWRVGATWVINLHSPSPLIYRATLHCEVLEETKGAPQQSWYLPPLARRHTVDLPPGPPDQTCDCSTSNRTPRWAAPSVMAVWMSSSEAWMCGGASTGKHSGDEEEQCKAPERMNVDRAVPVIRTLN